MCSPAGISSAAGAQSRSPPIFAISTPSSRTERASQFGSQETFQEKATTAGPVTGICAHEVQWKGG